VRYILSNERDEPVFGYGTPFRSGPFEGNRQKEKRRRLIRRPPLFFDEPGASTRSTVTENSMKNARMNAFRLPLAVAALALGVAGCGGGGGDNSQTFYGASQQVASGTARTYLVTKGNVPQAIGVQFDEAALTGWIAAGPPTFATEYRLALPQNIAQTPFTAISFYTTLGHPPEEVYEEPHIHPVFFLTPGGENDQITMDNPSADAPAAADETPTGHVSTHFALPDIGVVYSDPSDPHANEVPFHTYDLDFGFFNGHMNSENMTLAVSWLQQKQTFVWNITKPAKYPKAGYYPSTYTVSFDPSTKMYNAEFRDFVFNAGP
jgi:hypothetical protein